VKRISYLGSLAESACPPPACFSLVRRTIVRMDGQGLGAAPGLGKQNPLRWKGSGGFCCREATAFAAVINLRKDLRQRDARLIWRL
jgi:hypothetical protein